MAHPPPSPSGSCSSRRRRLSEVLGEQQEPFSLDLYLLERGCSPAFLDATACGGGAGACSTCWPRNGATARTLRRPPARNTKGSRRSGVLRTLLAKILSGTTTAPAPTKKKGRERRAAAIGWRRVVAGKQRTPADTLRSASSRAEKAQMEDAGEQEDDDGDGDDSSKKQLSPVSVLEQRLFEHSPSSPPPHAPNDLAIFGELLEANYTPNTLLDAVLAIVRDDPRSNSDSSTPPPPTTPRGRRRRKKKKHQARRKEDLGRLSSLVVSEMAGAGGVRAVDLRPWVEDVGAAIAAAVLEALTEETAAELMGIDGHRGCAADTATL